LPFSFNEYFSSVKQLSIHKTFPSKYDSGCGYNNENSAPPFNQPLVITGYAKSSKSLKVWYGILGFNVPLDTVQVISETGALSSDVHLPVSNGGPVT